MTKKISILLCFVFFSVQVFAEETPPIPYDGQPALPINGGILYLLAGAVVYGVYSLRKKH